MGATLTIFALFALLLFLSGLFSGTETALTSIGRVRVRQLIEQHGGRAEPLQLWLDKPERYLTTLLICNNAVNAGATVLGTLIGFELFGDDTGREIVGGFATGAMTLLLLIFGEITPKHFCKRHAAAISLLMIRPLHVLAVLLYPLEKVLSLVSGALIWVLSLGRVPKLQPFGEDELVAAVRLSGEEGAIEEREQSMIEQILKLDDQAVREIMVPRVQMTALAIDADRDEVSRVVVESARRRIPLFGANRDDIKGILHTHDLLKVTMAGGPIDLAEMARPAIFVPESKPVDEMLVFFQAQHSHLAIVVNEHGGVEGLVTLEDVLEEIVGEIVDEHDSIVTQLRPLTGGGFRFDGMIELKKVERAMGLSFETVEVNLNGWLSEQLGHLPTVGDRCQVEGWDFVVSAANNKVATTIDAQPASPGEPAAAPEAS